MSTQHPGSPAGHRPRLSAVRREQATVTPLELFFDLIFVLALSQCTRLMAEQLSWEGVARAMLILAVLWWSWVGYAWLTSVVDPEEGAVRIVVIVAIAAFLVAALCVPEAFGDLGLLFAGAYAVVRAAHIALFFLSSRDDPKLRSSVTGLAISTAIGTTLLAVASQADGALQGALWAAAVVLDAGGPFFFGAEGWKIVPHHFAERHGLILIIALGESIVAIGVGAEAGIDTAVVVSAVLGVIVAAALWWMYFDVVALVATRHLGEAAPGREQNEMARDSYSYLHFPMVAGVVLVALGFKKVVGHPGEELKLVAAVALLGGVAMYLLAHVAFRLRNVRSLSTRRVVVAGIVLAMIPLTRSLSGELTLGILAAVLVGLITYETVRYAEARDRVRHQLAH